MEQNHFQTASTDRAVQFDAGLQSHFHRVYGTMALGLVITGLTAFITSTIPAMVGLLVAAQSNFLISMLVAFSPMIIIAMTFNPYTARRLSATSLSLIFFGFSAYFGWLLSMVFLAYTSESIARVFFITAATFAAMSIWGYTTKKDLSSMGSFLMMGVIGLIIAMVVNMFLQSEMMMFIISGAGVIIYTLMTAWDTQQIKESYHASHGEQANAKAAVFGALTLYINFIMLFQFLLQLLGNRE